MAIWCACFQPAHFPGEATGILYLDGNILCAGESGVRDQHRLAFGACGRQPCGERQGADRPGPVFDLDGLPEVEDDDYTLSEVVRSAATGTIRSFPEKRRTDTRRFAEAIRRAVRSEVNAVWGRKPIVKVMVHKV